MPTHKETWGCLQLAMY